MKTGQHGFVLIEIIVVFGLIATLITLTSLNVFGSSRKATLTGTIDTLVSDIKSTQTKAMSATVQGGVVPLGYGIRFGTNQYILFSGLTYNPTDTSNAIVPLDSRVLFSAISLPDNSVVFASQSGDVAGFSPTANSVTLNQIDSGEVKTIQFNRYGTITGIN